MKVLSISVLALSFLFLLCATELRSSPKIWGTEQVCDSVDDKEGIRCIVRDEHAVRLGQCWFCDCDALLCEIVPDSCPPTLY